MAQMTIEDRIARNLYRISKMHLSMKYLYILFLILIIGLHSVQAQTDTLCDAPYLKCKETLSFTITAPFVFPLYPTDLLDSVADNCTPGLPLEYSIVPASEDRGIYPLDCAGLPFVQANGFCNVVEYQVWGKNAAGKVSKCSTVCSFFDPTGTCNGSLWPYRGCVTTQLGVSFDSVLIHHFVDNDLEAESFFIGGHYNARLPLLSAGQYFRPYYNVLHRNGVSSFDLLLLSRHILGVDTLDSPYLLIAADANKSGTLTSFDIVELRKLVLGVYDSLPFNESWRFVASHYIFPNPQNPFTEVFPERVFPEIPTRNDFIAIKIGDLNLNALPPGQLQAAEDRNAPILPLALRDRKVAAGEVFEVNIATPAEAEALQFSLEHYGLELLDFTPEAPYTKEHFAHFPEKATLTAAFDLGAAAAFTLRFRAQHEGFLSELLRFSDAVTHSEAVVAQQVYKPVLQFEPAGDFSIAPNPNVGQGVISFRLEKAEQVRLCVYDALGRSIWEQNENYPAGAHQIALDLGGQRGVFYVVKNDVVRQVVVTP